LFPEVDIGKVGRRICACMERSLAGRQDEREMRFLLLYAWFWNIYLTLHQRKGYDGDEMTIVDNVKEKDETGRM
jgi:hypothetical protein